MNNFNTPIAVDLDGSLVFTDMLYETFVRAIVAKPWLVLFIIPWLLKGRSYLKFQLMQHSNVDVSVLPYNMALIDYLKEQKGRPLILCTATHQDLAERISSHLGIFTDVIGSSKVKNIAGTVKANILCERFGEKGFTYVGNELRDLKIWKKAKSAVVVGGQGLSNKAFKLCTVEQTFTRSKLSLRTFLKAIRVHQWVKNALIFIPLITSHKFTELPLIITCFVAFIAFGFCASATYLINDLTDLDSDRNHWKKKLRPLACGSLSIKAGFFIIAIMLIVAGFLAFSVSLAFFITLCGYTAITLGYSFLFKRLQTVDIVVLAALYTLRIIAGGAAIGVEPSFWLLTLSMFVFLSLAIVKRISEVLKAIDNDSGEGKLSGRGYFTSDIDILRSLASSSGMVSILVFAMYINSPDVIVLYSHPQALWLVCPVFAYWLMRVLIMSSRGEIDEDPITFALKDTRSWFAGIAIAIAIFAAL